MKVTSEQQAPREAVLTVDLDESDVEPYLEQAYRQAVRRLNIPGFRKGKAPRRIIEQMFGREYLLNEALDSMVQESTSKAVEQEQLELGGIPSVSIESFDPPSFKAVVPLVPEVDLGDYESVRVERGKVEVTDEQIGGVLSQLSRDLAVWEPVEGPVQMDDLIDLTIVGWVEDDGERREIIRSENTEYIPRPNTRFPVPDFDDALVGLPQNKKQEFTIDVPEDFETEELAGKKAFFEATVQQVKRKEPPALDDEFAKGVGDGFESIAALRERIAEDFRAREERNVTAAHQDETLAKVVEGATFQISQLIIDHELEHYVEDKQEEFKAGRISTIEDYQQFLSWQAMTPEEVLEDSRPRVEERLKRAHALREVARQQKFDAADADVDAEVEVMAEEAGSEADQVRKLFIDEDRRDSLRRVLINRQALDYLTELSGRTTKTASKKTAKAKAAAPATKKASTRGKSRAGSGSESGGS